MSEALDTDVRIWPKTLRAAEPSGRVIYRRVQKSGRRLSFLFRED